MIMPEMEKKDKTEKRNILELTNPLIGAWPDQSFLMSMLLNCDTGYDWVMNMYVQTYGSYFKVGNYVEDTKLVPYPFANQNIKSGMYDLCPFVNRYLVPREDIVREKYTSFFEFVKHFIDKNYYITVTLDRLSLLGMRVNELTKEEYDGPSFFVHPVNIYGYDMEKGVVYCTDNFDSGIYQSKEINIEDLNYSFADVLLPDFISEYEAQVRVYRQVSYFTWQFDKELLIGLLKDYLYPKKNIDYLYNFVITPYKDTINDGKFGIESYDFLITYLQDFLDGKRHLSGDKTESVDKRSFCYLQDHKRLMRLRVEYLMKNSYIPEDEKFLGEFIALEKDAERLKYLSIKADMTNRMCYMEKLLNLLKMFRTQDENLVKQLIERLES